MLDNLNTFLFDLDGTVYRTTKAVTGAREVLKTLRQKGKRCLFVSNNSTHTCSQLCTKLADMGIESSPEDFLTPLRFSGAFISSHYGLCRVYVMGMQTLSKQVALSGHTLVQRGELCDVVLVGRDLECTYKKLETAGAFLQKGARLIACNTDLTHPGENGYEVPETGAFLAALLAVHPCEYDEIGKPTPFLFHCAGDTQNSVMIGDNVETDIAGGAAAGCKTVLISSDAPPQAADLVIPDMPGLLRLIANGAGVLR